MYYPSSENKGADQLRGYREADLRLCFRLCKLLDFPWGGSFMKAYFACYRHITAVFCCSDVFWILDKMLNFAGYKLLYIPFLRYALVICNYCPTPTPPTPKGKGRDHDFSALSALL